MSSIDICCVAFILGYHRRDYHDVKITKEMLKKLRVMPVGELSMKVQALYSGASGQIDLFEEE